MRDHVYHSMNNFEFMASCNQRQSHAAYIMLCAARERGAPLNVISFWADEHAFWSKLARANLFRLLGVAPE